MRGLIAFDGDVLIYAASPQHPLGKHVATLFSDPHSPVGIGSVLLLTEVLAKPLREDDQSEDARTLMGLLSRLDLLDFDENTAALALALALTYRLRAADAAHLATAVAAGADYFLTNNHKDFPKQIAEIHVLYPQDLAED